MREHWLQHAHGRIVAGDSEPDVLADYGWVQITDAEREALEQAIDAANGMILAEPWAIDTLRKMLERLK